MRACPAKFRAGETRPNQAWVMHVVHDRLATGPKLRMLTNIDTFSRYAPALAPRSTFRGVDGVEVPARVGRQVGFPTAIRIGLGTGFVSRDSDLRACQRGLTLDFSRQGKFDRHGCRDILLGGHRHNHRPMPAPYRAPRPVRSKRDAAQAR